MVTILNSLYCSSAPRFHRRKRLCWWTSPDAATACGLSFGLVSPLEFFRDSVHHRHHHAVAPDIDSRDRLFIGRGSDVWQSDAAKFSSNCSVCVLRRQQQFSLCFPPTFAATLRRWAVPPRAPDSPPPAQSWPSRSASRQATSPVAHRDEAASGFIDQTNPLERRCCLPD